MEKKYLAGIIIVLAVVGVLAYSFGKKQQELVVSVDPVVVSPSPSATLIAEQFIHTTPDIKDLQVGGSSYADPKGLYVFLYPADYAVDTQEEGKYTRILKKGATQKGQTELYDGVLVVFESVKLEGKSLSEWVDTRIKESSENGTVEITQAKKAMALNKYPGFTYEVRGLGSSTYLVLQKSPQSTEAVSITFLVADPENKDYQREVDAILSTLELRK